VRFVELAAEFVRNHLKAGAESFRIEDDLRVFQPALALKPPLAVRIAHNLAHRVIKQEFLDWLEKRYEKVQVVVHTAS